MEIVIFLSGMLTTYLLQVGITLVKTWHQKYLWHRAAARFTIFQEAMENSEYENLPVEKKRKLIQERLIPLLDSDPNIELMPEHEREAHQKRIDQTKLDVERFDTWQRDLKNWIKRQQLEQKI